MKKLMILFLALFGLSGQAYGMKKFIKNFGENLGSNGSKEQLKNTLASIPKIMVPVMTPEELKAEELERKVERVFDYFVDSKKKDLYYIWLSLNETATDNGSRAVAHSSYPVVGWKQSFVDTYLPVAKKYFEKKV